MTGSITTIQAFIFKTVSDSELASLVHEYLPPNEYGILNTERQDAVRTLTQYAQERYLLLELLTKVKNLYPAEFLDFFGHSFSSDIYRYGDLDQVRPVPGAVLLDNVAFLKAEKLLAGEERTKFQEGGDFSFACLMQLIEALVLHNQIWVVDLTVDNLATAPHCNAVTSLPPEVTRN